MRRFAIPLIAAGIAVATAAPAAASSHASSTNVAHHATAERSHLRFLSINVPGASGTSAAGVNDSGVIAGFWSDRAGTSHGFVLAGTRLVRFDPPGSVNTFPSGINDADTVAGTFLDRRGRAHGFLRSSDGRFTIVNDPLASRRRGDGTQVESLNDRGAVVGYYADKRGVWHGFVLKAGRFTTVDGPHAGTHSGQGTFLNGINNAGQIAGLSIDGHGQAFSFVVTAHGLVSFPTPQLYAYGISASGVVVGSRLTHREHSDGWVFRGFSFTALNDPRAGKGGDGRGTYAFAIDEHGDLVAGEYVTNRGVSHGYIVHLGE